MNEKLTLGPRKTVTCGCGKDIFDGVVVKSRVVRLLPRGGAEALCRCKQWVPVPLTYTAEHLPENCRARDLIVRQVAA